MMRSKEKKEAAIRIAREVIKRQSSGHVRSEPRRSAKNYNAATEQERTIVYRLIPHLAHNFMPVRKGNEGIRQVYWPDAVICVLHLVMEGRSARSFAIRTRELWRKGIISRPYAGPTINGWFESDDLTHYLLRLVDVSSRPVAELERVVIIDSTGFTMSIKEHWYDMLYGEHGSFPPRSRNDWIKFHGVLALKSRMFVTGNIHERDASDVGQFIPLIRQAAARLPSCKDVLADKVYAIARNFNEAERLGLELFTDFKTTHTGKAGGAFKRQLIRSREDADAYYRVYNQRSLIESAFSAVKRRFRANLRCKTQRSGRNEVLCRILIYNLIRLSHVHQEYGIDYMAFGEPSPYPPAPMWRGIPSIYDRTTDEFED